MTFSAREQPKKRRETKLNGAKKLLLDPEINTIRRHPEDPENPTPPMTTQELHDEDHAPMHDIGLEDVFHVNRRRKRTQSSLAPPEESGADALGTPFGKPRARPNPTTLDREIPDRERDE
jgi:hypothetical protein